MEKILLSFGKRWRLLAGLRNGNKTPELGAEPVWLDDVRRGRFEAIPGQLNWDSAAPMIFLINGYVASTQLGWGDLRSAAIRLEQLHQQGTWTGSATELWCYLFHEYRRYRHGGWPPEGADRERLDRLIVGLRGAILNAPPDEQTLLVTLMDQRGSDGG